MSTEFAAGSLVTARGREWVVQPGSSAEVVVVRPLGGTDAELAALLPSAEAVTSATFAPPSPDDRGDDRSGRMLRDALRIGFRSSGGPFRALAALNVDPRPYQLVPLLLALRQEPVRMLIADDVGIGKTIEAGLVAKELLAQGTVSGLAVLCPPSLAQQWQRELSEKFGLDAQLVLPGTIAALERGLSMNESVFERYPVTVISLDFIKAERRMHDFLRTAPDLLIIDEAHTVADDDTGHGGKSRMQRYRLVRELADDPKRNIILTTATPHSGNEGAFRNLIGLLNDDLIDVDLDSEAGRRLLARHMVQRRRADIRAYLGTDTMFPKDRQTKEEPYSLTPGHAALFADVLTYVRGQVKDRSGTKLAQRIRWWSALALLRAMASSPAAAHATLLTRASAAEAKTDAAADAMGAAEVLDQYEDEGMDAADVSSGADSEYSDRRALRKFAETAGGLAQNPATDAKLALLIAQVKKLVREGDSPIVFCRFIQTARYVLDALAAAMPRVAMDVVTGEFPSEERARRIADLAERSVDAQRVLVATDCLSEGVNLQDDFQAVIHYDLAWNPTRHEQREGRVDRFGQPREIVRAITLYGADNGIDGIVLDVLLRKHEKIRKALGVSVPVPPQSDQLLAALLEGALLRGTGYQQLELDLGLDEDTQAGDFDSEWQSSAEREQQSRTRFAQASIHPNEVTEALEAARRSLGDPGDVSEFVRDTLQELGGLVRATGTGLTVDAAQMSLAAKDALRSRGGGIVTAFASDLPAPKGTAVLHRSDPTVASIASHVLNAALDPALPAADRPARRAAVVTTTAVTAPTVALLVRFRTHLVLPTSSGDRTSLAEEARIVAFRGVPSSPDWLAQDETDELLVARATSNTPDDSARNFLTSVIAALPKLAEPLDERAQAIAEQLREDHAKIRLAARGDRAEGLTIRGLQVRPQLPVDVLGVYIYLPGAAR